MKPISSLDAFDGINKLFKALKRLFMHLLYLHPVAFLYCYNFRQQYAGLRPRNKLFWKYNA